MNSAFSAVDWGIFAAYFLVLTITSVLLSRVKVKSTRDYFVGGNSVPMFAVAISVLATSQSAATFLGGPEYSYGKDLTFIVFYISAFLAVILVTFETTFFTFSVIEKKTVDNFCFLPGDAC